MARKRDLVSAHQAFGVLDLRLDADASDLVSQRLLELQQRSVDERDVAGVAHLGDHDAIEDVAGAGDHLAQVVEGELAGHLVDAHHARLAVPVMSAQRLDHLGPRRGFLQRGARILEVEEHLVGRARRGLLHHPRVAAGNGKN